MLNCVVPGELPRLPVRAQTERAERVTKALRGWGEQASRPCSARARRVISTGRHRGGHTQLHLQVASDDPHVLAWPWEALHDPQRRPGAHCRIERQLDQLRDPPDPYPTICRAITSTS